MKNSYVNILIESLKDKDLVLDEVIAEDKKQAEILKSEDPDLQELEKSQERIGELAVKLDKLNEGFQSVYDRVRGELQSNKDQYKDEIRILQELITIITGKSVKVEAEQNRNKKNAQKLFKEKKKNFAAQRSTVRKLNLYANQMHNVIPAGQAEAAFLDKKK